MKKLARTGTALLFTLFYACGISTKHVTARGDDGGSAAGDTTVGTGGTPNLGGSSNRGGAGGTNDRSGAGGTDNHAGTGGGGSSGDGPTCALAPVFTQCEPSGGFYHDPKTNECLHVTGFQCTDSPNAFPSLAACLAACPSAKPAMAACDGPSDCSVVSRGCCGLCPDDAITGAQALNSLRLSDRAVCGDVACTPCPPTDPNTGRVQYYVPACNFGTCDVVDFSESQATECEVDGDCHLRDGADCCEQCDGTGLIALSSEAELGAAVCSGATSCIGCAHTYDGYRARCQDGYCRVQTTNVLNNGGNGAGGNGAGGNGVGGNGAAGCSGEAPACRGLDHAACCEQDPYGIASCMNGQWVCAFSEVGPYIPAPGCNGTPCGFGGQSGDGFGGQAGGN